MNDGTKRYNARAVAELDEVLRFVEVAQAVGEDRPRDSEGAAGGDDYER